MDVLSGEHWRGKHTVQEGSEGILPQDNLWILDVVRLFQVAFEDFRETLILAVLTGLQDI